MKQKHAKNDSPRLDLSGLFDLFGSNGVAISTRDLQNGLQQDAAAIHGDWCAVGAGLQKAMDAASYELQSQ